MLLGRFLCDINAGDTYSWYSGIWHGLFFVPNVIWHWINSDILYKANDYTTGYNIWWWIFTIQSVLGTLFGGASGRR